MKFSIDDFKKLYPEFASIDEDFITLMSEKAECFISANECKCGKVAIMLMTAHLLTYAKNNQEGSMNGVITNASIDKVSVALKTFDTQDSWVFWLNQTPYGIELLALIKRDNPAIYIGGVPERSAFRRAGGYPYARRNRW